MKKIIGITLCVALLLFCTINAQAANRLSILKSGDFTQLSDKDKEETITALVEKISKDLELQSTPRLYFYFAKDYAEAAGYYDCINYIYINMAIFADHEDADAAGETVGFHLVKILAHECRHDYQFEHMQDDTEFGRAVKANKENYRYYYDDLEAYKNQFTEVDAESYAEEYANNFFKGKQK